MTAIFKRELRSYFHGMLGYVLTAFLLASSGIYFLALNLGYGLTDFGYYTLYRTIFMLLLYIPVLTMRSLAEERSSSSSTGDSVRTSSEDTSVVLAGSGKEALETGTVLPQVRGVAVVCAGAANPAVKEKIANAVCGALGIRLSRVCVTY